MATRTGVKAEAHVGATLLVIHNFTARSGDELSLAKGERIELIERDDDFGDGWFLGRHVDNGRTGLFPEVYTTAAPKPTLPNAYQQRGASETVSRTPQSSDAISATSPTQLRHISAAAAPNRPVSAFPVQQSAPAPAVQPSNIRTSLPMTNTTQRDEAISTASPVMNETLSVINEHMNDMHKPSPYSSPTKRHSTGPGYSYIAGEETDDEENEMHTEEEVMSWSPDRVADYLEEEGVERSHCDVFKEQDITGEVLLAMEQSSLFLKEFSLGSVGRRLKTWHKIRALQDEVQAAKGPVAPDGSPELTQDTLAVDTARSRASTVGSALPRALDTSRQSIAAPTRSSTLQPPSQSPPSPTSMGGTSPLGSLTSNAGPETTWRPSAQSIREMQLQRRQSRRQSSIEGSSAPGSVDLGHRKQPSLDRNWQPGQPQINGQLKRHSYSLSSDAVYLGTVKRDAGLPLTPDKDDLERDYLSSPDADSRSQTNTTIATSKTSVDVPGSEMSRSSSSGNRRSTQPGTLRDSMSPTVNQNVFNPLNPIGNTLGSFRSSTSPIIRKQPQNANPVVTKLDYSASTEALSQLNSLNDTNGATPRSTTSPKLPFMAYKPKLTGLRTISDAITKHERLTASPTKEREGTSPARTGSTTPSTETKSLDVQKSEAQSRISGASATNLLLPPTKERKIRVKPKKATSAYTRGLERKPPAEQMIGSDYSGWMKKKSGSLMTTWKTRLFVLRGRRLSYYYADADTEEKGLIDISFHRVLPAHNETLTGLHATVTGAAASPSSPKDSVTQTAAQQDLAQHPAIGEPDSGVFIFKLVPPKSGLSKGVNFTKPTVHYFAVNSRQEGRLWMAALMKATIDRDDDGMVTTSYNQKTISLAKARARRERPPALMESDDDKMQAELEGGDDDSASRRGLGIDGLIGEDSEQKSVVAGADDASSVVPSTIATEAGESVNEKTADGVATS